MTTSKPAPDAMQTRLANLLGMLGGEHDREVTVLGFPRDTSRGVMTGTFTLVTAGHAGGAG